MDNENQDELWLMIKDSNNKRIKAHIKFDITDYVQSKINNVYDYVSHTINYACEYIDDKHFSMLKKGMEYDLAGIKEYADDGKFDDPQLKNMLYSFEKDLSKMIEYVNKSLDYGRIDLERLYKFILGIFEGKKILNDFKDVQYHTEQQMILIDVDLYNVIKKFNDKIDWQKNNIMQQTFFQNWSLPPWFALENLNNAQEYVNKIESLKIKGLELQELE